MKVNFFTRFSLKNPTVIALFMVLVVGFGALQGFNMKTELMPNINVPVITVSTFYFGASPDDIQANVTAPLEKALSAVKGVKKVTSVSNENISMIIGEFDYSQDMDKAEQDIQAAVNRAALPDQVSDPKVSKVTFGGAPILIYSVTGGEKAEQEKLITEQLKPQLEAIAGVSEVEITGLTDDNIYIRLDSDKLKKYNLTLDSVKQALTGNNIAFPAGTAELGDKTVPIKISNKLKSVEQLGKIPVVMPNMPKPQQPMPSQNAEFTQLKDIAEITTGKEQPQLYSRVNGSSALIISIKKTDEGNSIEIADQAYSKIAEFEKSIGGDFKYTKIFDQASQVHGSIDGLLKEGILGAFFAVVIVALFLRNFRATIVAIVSIPLSMFITLLILPRLGITINMMSLAGMAVAVGRVVDDSIVVIENTYRRLHEDSTCNRNDLFGIAAQEVASAITSSTIATVAVFLPLALVSGIIGKIFAPFAYTVVISILASLLVAVTVVPMLSKILFTKANSLPEKKDFFLQKYYVSLLNWSLKKRWAIVVISVLVMVLSLGLVSRVGVQFLAQDNARNLTVKMAMTPGTKLDKTNEMAMKFEQVASEMTDLELVQSTVGAQNSANGFGFNTQGSDGATFLVVVKEGADIEASVENLRTKLISLENTETKFLLTTQNQSGTTENVEILVKGENIDDLREASELIAAEIKSIPELTNITNSLTEEKPEILIQVLPDRAVERGLSPVMVAGMVRGVLTEAEVTTIEHSGQTKKVILALDQATVQNVEKIKDLELSTMMGKVSLKEIAEVKLVDGPVSISRLDGHQYASVKADVLGTNTQTTATETLEKINNINSKLPKSVSYELSGSSEDIKESFTQMGIAIIIAVVMVYLVMVITFGEATSPFALLFSLPFAAAGGLLGLFVTQQPLSMSSLIGLLMLIGIVVTNAIVLVDRVQQNRVKGMAVNEALLEAGKVRLRPILMTAISTIMALVPLAVSSTEGALISEGLAIVVIGGLTLSTLLTLVVVPVAYSYLHQVKGRVIPETKATITRSK